MDRRGFGDSPDVACSDWEVDAGDVVGLLGAGIRIPADIAVVGFDDIHLSAMLAPPLTTVRQPMRLLGQRACPLLLERIADPALPSRQERLPTELVMRESCGCAP
jgi:LacI family transcriptional regulator